MVHIRPASDPRLANYSDSDYPLPFYASVHAWGANAATFSILATSNPTVTLTNGVPAAGAASAYSLTYYSFYVPAPPAGQTGKSFEVTVVPLSGGPADLYVQNDLNNPYPICTGSCSAGAITNYRWSSVASAVRSRVVVAAGSPYYATGRNYVIALYAEDDVSYTITAGFSDSWRTLQSGVPVQDTVGTGAAVFYRLLLQQANADVQVTVTPLSGDPVSGATAAGMCGVTWPVWPCIACMP